MSKDKEAAQIDELAALVDTMIELNAKNHTGTGETDAIRRTDKMIDKLVYELFNLTDEEISIIDGAFEKDRKVN
jgi:hypothetical protein